MTSYSEQTQAIDHWVKRLNAGDDSAREELLKLANERLLNLTRKMKQGFRRVGRWEETDDIFQQASFRLYESLNNVQLQDTTHFLRLAATQIRRQLIDLSRSYYGPEGRGKHHATNAGAGGGEHTSPGVVPYDPAEVSQDPQRVQEWSEFHQMIEGLPDDQKAVVDLLWYHNLTQDEVAESLKVSLKTVKRRWRAAKLTLHDQLGELPGGI